MNDDSLLAAIAGYVDTLSFFALFGLFTAHVTGNFVLIGGGVTGYGQGVFLRLMAFPVFILGVALSSFFRGRNPETPIRGACMLYAVQALRELLATARDGPAPTRKYVLTGRWRPT